MSLVSKLAALGKLAAGTLAIGGPFGAGLALAVADTLGAGVILAAIGVGVGFFGFATFASLDAQEAVEHDRRLRRSEG